MLWADPATSSNGTTTVFPERTPNALRGDFDLNCLKLLRSAIFVRAAELRKDPPTVTILSAEIKGMLWETAILSSTL